MEELNLVLISENPQFTSTLQSKLNNANPTISINVVESLGDARTAQDLELVDGILFAPKECNESVRSHLSELSQPIVIPIIVFVNEPCTENRVKAYLDVGVSDVIEVSNQTTGALLSHKIQQTIQSFKQNESDLLLDRVTEALFSLDQNYQFRTYNQQGLDLIKTVRNTTLEIDSIRGEKLWNVFPEIMGTQFEEEFEYAMEREEQRHFTSYYEPLDLWVEVSVYPSATGLSIFVRDVTEKKQLELDKETNLEVLFSLYDLAAQKDLSHTERIKNAIKLGREMLDLSYGFVTQLTDTEQRIEISQHSTPNPDLSEGSVCPIDETYCQHILDKVGPLTIENARDQGMERTVEYERFRLNSYISQKIIINGEIYGTLCFADDNEKERSFSETELAITELLSGWISYELQQKQTQEAIQEKNEQLEAFAGFVSHDLRNPLSIAQGYLGMEMKETESENLEKVKNAHDRMENLITNLLDLTQTEDVINSTEPLSVEQISKDSWSHIQTNGAVLNVTTTMEIDAHYDKLLNVFENLYKNAIEHNTGEVRITVGETDSGFYIQDNGSGIDTENIFDYGVSGSGSTGLGLSIVQKIVTAHGWTIELDSSYTDGAKFVINTK